MRSLRDKLVAGENPGATVTSAATARPTNDMKLSAKIQFVATVGFALSTLALAQTTQQQPPQPATVTYNSGKLFVSANNSSLNQILRDIAHETGMKITGGVTDERVFGQYGPDAPSKILNSLLDGTGSNMLLLQATSAAPAELILTARHGGPTPPNPRAAAEDDFEPPPARPQYPLPTPPESNAPRSPNESQPAQPGANTPKTPQQIYEQLQRLRQQQQQQQSNPQ